MSSSNLDIITDALRDLGVISEVQTPSAEQGAHGLRELNKLCAELEGDDVPLQWFEQTLTSDTFPIAKEYENAIAALLAARLAPNYGATISQELAAKIIAGNDHLTRVAVKAALKPYEGENMPCGSADSYGFNINTG